MHCVLERNNHTQGCDELTGICLRNLQAACRRVEFAWQWSQEKIGIFSHQNDLYEYEKVDDHAACHLPLVLMCVSMVSL